MRNCSSGRGRPYHQSLRQDRFRTALRIVQQVPRPRLSTRMDRGRAIYQGAGEAQDRVIDRDQSAHSTRRGADAQACRLRIASGAASWRAGKRTGRCPGILAPSFSCGLSRRGSRGRIFSLGRVCRRDRFTRRSSAGARFPHYDCARANVLRAPPIRKLHSFELRSSLEFRNGPGDSALGRDIEAMLTGTGRAIAAALPCRSFASTSIRL